MDGHARFGRQDGIAGERYPILRTDAAGLIRYASPDLLRISRFVAEDLVGRAEGILLDPAMPAGLQWHMRRVLQAGLPAGAYMRNLTRDERCHWVFALTAPLAEGAITIQMRPLGPQLDKVRAVYAKMRAAEDEGMAAEEAAALMAAELGAQGAGLSGFLADALASEVRARRTLRLAQELSLLDSLDLLRAAASSFAEEQSGLLETFRALYLVPTNMRILASRLEPAGGPISAIADSYKRASTQITSALDEMMGVGETSVLRVQEGTEDAITGIACAILLQQAREQLAREVPCGGPDELGALATAEAASRARVRDAAGRMAQAVRNISKDGQTLQRLMAGLDQIRILGQVESGRHRDRDGSLGSIMAQLGNFHASIHVHLNAMIDLGSRMRAGAARFIG